MSRNGVSIKYEYKPVFAVYLSVNMAGRYMSTTKEYKGVPFATWVPLCCVDDAILCGSMEGLFPHGMGETGGLKFGILVCN